MAKKSTKRRGRPRNQPQNEPQKPQNPSPQEDESIENASFTPTPDGEETPPPTPEPTPETNPSINQVVIDLPVTTMPQGYHVKHINMGALTLRERKALHMLNAACFKQNKKFKKPDGTQKHVGSIADTIRFMLQEYANAAGIE